MADIDSLEIKIESEASGALKSLDKLIGKLDSLQNALKIDTSGIANIGKIGDFSALKDVSKNLNKLSKGLNSLNDVDTSKINSISTAVSNMSKSVSNTKSAESGSNGINKIINSIGRLGKTNLGNFNPSVFDKITKSVASISSMPDTSNSVNRLVSSIAKLANAGDKSEKVAFSLPELGRQLKKTVTTMSKANDISDSVNKFVESISRLANAGNKTGHTAGQLRVLSQGVLDFMNAMKNAPQISENTLRMTEAISKISSSGGKAQITSGSVVEVFNSISDAAKSAVSAVKKATSGIGSAISKGFGKIGRMGIGAANSIKKAASTIVSAFARIGNSSKGLKTASFNLGTLLKTAIGFKGIQALGNFAKSAINLGSDITEVENVVDVAFGSMAQHAYDFASTAMEQFGLSELAAKNYSGTMMAMLKSSGVAQGAAAKMSTTLAGLAGDLASFYNLDTDTAFYKIRAGISGEIEPLKQLGINMSVANMEAFALSQGITKSYNAMNQAEKTMLRYNYLLSVTSDQQGDFARTAGTWANQVRLLKLNFQSLSAVIGQGLIAAILPVIKWLNALMSKLMEAAKAFRNFMYTLMGKKLEGATSGIVNDIGGIDTGLDGIGDAAEEAGEKIKKNLLTLPFDELNILTEDADDISDSLGDFGDIDAGLGDFGSADVETPVNEWAKRIRDAFLNQEWEELGRTIAELVNAGLRKVYDAIIEITPKVEQALKNFAKVFNSFVEYLDWDLLGRTIGAGINLITTSINALLGDEGIDFENLGKKLSVGFRGMIDEIDWTGLGNAIGNWFMVAWRIADGFIEDMWRVSTETMKNGWEELGIAVGTAVNGIFDRIDFAQIASVLTEGFRGVLEAAASALDAIRFDEIVAKINAGLEVLASNLSWEHIGEQVTKFSQAIVKAFNDLLAIDFGAIGTIIGEGITIIVRAFNMLTSEGGIDFERLGKNISDGLRNLFSSIPWEEFGNALGNGFMIGWRILDGFITDMSTKNDAGLTGWAQLGISLGNAVNGIFEKIDFAAIADVLARGFNGLVEIIKNWATTIRWEDIASNISNGIMTFINGINWKDAGKTLSDFLTELFGTFQKVAHDTDWKAVGQSIGDFLSSIDWKTIFGQVFDTITTVLGGLIDGLRETTSGKVGLAVAGGVAAFSGLEGAISVIEPIVTGILGLLGPKGKMIAEIVKSVAAIAPAIAGFATTIAIGGKDLAVAANDLIHSLLDWLIDAIDNTDWGEIWRNIIEFLGNFDYLGIAGKLLAAGIKLIGHIVSGLIEGILTTNWLEIGLNLINGLVTGVTEYIGALLEIPKMIFDAIVNGIKSLFGIHSPSTVMAEIGGFMMEGLINGISSLVDSIKDIWNGIKETAINIWNGIGEALGGLWEGIKTSASEKFAAIKETVSNAWNGAKEKATEIWNNVSSYLSEKWESIKTLANEKFAVVREKVMDAWNGISEKTSEIWGKLKQTLGDTWENLKTTAGEKFEKLKENVTGVWDKVKTHTTETWDNVKKSLGEKVPKIIEDVKSKFSDLPNFMTENGKNTISGLINGITEKTAPLREKVKEIAGNVSGWFKEKLDIHSPSGVFKDIAGYTLQGFINGADSNQSKVKDTMINVAKGAIKAFNGIDKEFNSIGADTMTEMNSGVSGKLNLVKNQMTVVLNAMKSGFNGLADHFNNIGINAMQGMVRGLNSSDIMGVASNLANMVSNTFRNILGIHSPSTVFAEIGENTMQGYKNGIGAGENSVLSKMKGVADDSAKPLSGIGEEIAKVIRDGIYSVPYGQIVGEVMDLLVSGLNEAIGKLRNTILNQIGNMASLIKSVFNTIDFSSAARVMAEPMKVAVEFSKAKVYELIEFLKFSFDKLANYIHEIALDIKNSLSSAFDTDEVISKLEKTKQIISNISVAGFGRQSHYTPAFANGGFPEDGLFFANHTELVGQFSNGKTAVANNEQIIAGIRQAAYEGMRQALAESGNASMVSYLADIAQNTKETAEKDMSVRIGDTDIARANKRGAARLGYDFA